MTAIYFDTNALFIEGVRDAFVAGTLVATLEGDTVSICRVNEGSTLYRGEYWRITRGDGTGFVSALEAKAYLDGEFSRRRPVGDRLAIAVDIAVRGQTVIPLQDPPTILSTLRLVVNGVAYRAPEIAASDVAVTWLNPDFPLDPTDRVTVVYS